MEALELHQSPENYTASLELGAGDSIDFQPIPLQGVGISDKLGDLPILAEIQSGEDSFVVGDKRNYLQTSDEKPMPFGIYKVTTDNEGQKDYKEIAELGTSLATNEVKFGEAIASNIGSLLRITHDKDDNSESGIRVVVAKSGIMEPVA